MNNIPSMDPFFIVLKYTWIFISAPIYVMSSDDEYRRCWVKLTDIMWLLIWYRCNTDDDDGVHRKSIIGT